MDTLSETADKVDQGLQNMGLDGTSVKQSLKDILNFKEYLTEQLPALTGFCIKVVLSIIVFFVGRRIISWIVNIMRKSLERANIDAGVVQFISSAGKAVLYMLLIFNSDQSGCERIFCGCTSWNCRCDGRSGITGGTCESGRRGSAFDI